MNNKIHILKGIEKIPTEAERQAKYAELIKSDRDNKHYYQAYQEMEEEHMRERISRGSNVLSVLFEQIVDYGRPILAKLPINVVHTSFFKLGKPVKQSMLPQAAVDCKFSFTLVLNKAVDAIYADELITVTAGTTMQVCGIELTRYHDITNETIYSYFRLKSAKRYLATSGAYGLKDFQTNIYTLSRFTKIFDLPSGTINWRNDSDANIKITKIMRAIQYLKAVHSANFDILIRMLPRLTATDFVIPAAQTNLSIEPDAKYEPVEVHFIRNLFGKNSDELADLYEKMREANETSADANKLAILNRKNILRAQKNAIAYMRYQKNLENLDKNQLKLVEIDWTARKARLRISTIVEPRAIRNIIKNSAVDKDERDQLGKDVKNILSKLGIPKAGEAEILSHTSFLKDHDGVDVVCPHVIYQALLKIKQVQDIRKLLLSEYELPGLHEHCCKICGEEIDLFQNEEMPKQVLTQKDSTNIMMWTIIMSIVKTSIIFHASVNLSRFVTSIVNDLYDEITNIQNKLLKIKSSNAHEAKIYTRFNIAVYAYAVLIHIIIQNRGRISIIGYKPDQNKLKNMQKLFTTVLKLIIKQHLAPTGMTTEMIKNSLLTAYKWVLQQHKEPYIMATKEVTSELSYMLATTPVYSYIHKMNMLKHFLEGGDWDSRPRLERDVELLLGRPLSKINADMKKDIGPFNTVPDIAWPKGAAPSLKLIQDSYDHFIDYIKNNLFEQNAARFSEKESDPSAADYLEEGSLGPISISLKEYYIQPELKKLTYEVTESKKIFRIRDRFYSNAPTDHVMLANWYNPADVNYGKFYCTTGTKHKFNIYVFGDADIKEEATSSDIEKWISDKKVDKLKHFKTLHITDYRCSLCDQLLSSAEDSNIEQALLNIEHRKAFSLFYASRCPEGDLHTYGADMQCTKCGLGQDTDEASEISYYNKYKGEFDKQKNEKIKNIVDILSSMLLTVSEKPPSKTKIAQISKIPIQITENVYQWAKDLDKSYNALINIGLSENLYYDRLVKELDNPQANVTNETAGFRNTKLLGYVMWLMRQCLLLKNYKDLYELPIDLRAILEKHHKKQLNIAETLVNENFYAEYENLDSSAEPKSISYYLLDNLAQIILRINKISTIGHDLALYFTNYIMNAERVISVPEPQKYIHDTKADDAPSASDVTPDVIPNAIQDIDQKNIDDFSTYELDIGQGKGFDEDDDETHLYQKELNDPS